MELEKLSTKDGKTINYAMVRSKPDDPWIALIIPFGLKLDMAKNFFEFFKPHFNIVVWETRSILDPAATKLEDGEFSIENHISDMRVVLDACEQEKYIVVGYCSGAGLALAAANRYPNMIETLILVHGEYTMLDDSECTTQFAQEIDSLLSLAAKDEEHLGLVFEKIKEDRIESNDNRPDGIDMPFTKKEYLQRHAANYVSYKSVDFENLARWVTHKTFLMSGKRDVQANVASTEKIAALLPNSEVYIDAEADHYDILREDSATMITIWNYLCDLNIHRIPRALSKAS